MPGSTGWRLLLANGLFCVSAGVAAVAWALPAADGLAMPSRLVTAMGAVFVAYGLAVLAAARRRAWRRGLLVLVTALDVAWAAASLAFLALYPHPQPFLTVLSLASVSAFAVLQIAALRRAS